MSEKMVKLDDLLKSRGWDKMKELIIDRQKKLGLKIIYGDCMDVKDPNLTQSDLLRAEIKCLAWIVEKLPEQMIENPDYKADEDIQELEGQQQAEYIDNMFKQSE